MTRVSENSSSTSIQYSINKAKERLEDLQIKGSTLKSLTKPSDNPVANLEALNIGAITSDNKQFVKNSDFALMQLNSTEQALEQLTDIMVKAKEIAIGQSSDLYNDDVRKNISNEVIQLHNMALAIANKRIGNRYIFGGFSTLKPPFDHSGNYNGDNGKIRLEVSKDFFIPINLHGKEVFFGEANTGFKEGATLRKAESLVQLDNKDKESKGRSVAQIEGEQKLPVDGNLFSHLTTLVVALENGDGNSIQNLLEGFDKYTTKLITLRTQVGSLTQSVMHSKNNIEAENIEHASRKSSLLDADITELFSDITKQQQVLKTTYQTSGNLLSQNLLQFLR